MRKINIPVFVSFSTYLIDSHALEKRFQPQGVTKLDSKIMESVDTFTGLNQIKANGAQIVYGTISIESKINEIIALSYLGKSEKKEKFKQDVLETSYIPFNSKKEIMKTIVKNNNSIDKNEFDEISKYLRMVMDWRNAFAHGSLSFD